jgi:hypothetical protein
MLQGINKSTEHGTQPGKGTMPRTTERRNEPKLLHQSAVAVQEVIKPREVNIGYCIKVPVN